MFPFRKTKQEPTVFAQILADYFNEFTNDVRDRLVLQIAPLDKETAAEYRALISGDWIDMATQGEHQYYTYDLLEEKERRLVKNREEYQALSFVMPRTFGQAPYEEPGIEVITRVHTKAQLPKFIPESNMNYHSIKRFFPASNLASFVATAQKVGYGVEDLVRDVTCAKHEYDQKTRELFMNNKEERDRVLLAYEQRNVPADAYLFVAMQDAIAKANQEKALSVKKYQQ